jgi:hypothetical protein
MTTPAKVPNNPFKIRENSIENYVDLNSPVIIVSDISSVHYLESWLSLESIES